MALPLSFCRSCIFRVDAHPPRFSNFYPEITPDSRFEKISGIFGVSKYFMVGFSLLWMVQYVRYFRYCLRNILHIVFIFIILTV